MKKLLLLVDSKPYIKANCYQHQLYSTLRQNFKIKCITSRQITQQKPIVLEQYDCILSVLRQRTLLALRNQIKVLLQGFPVSVYDQDPWQGFMDDSPYKNSYFRIADCLNINNFLVTSNWWSEYLAKQGFSTRFVRMGMLPKYCKLGNPWERRGINLGFQGSLHTHRKQFFDELTKWGITVSFFTSAKYKNFLKNLNNIQIYIHTEQAPWKIDNQWYPRNALWIKDIEAAARGCFAIRDYEEESIAYDIDKIPTIFTYREIKEVPDIIHYINSLDTLTKNQMIKQSVEHIKQRADWETVVHALQ
ncbi:MAG: hypothetical protein Tsb005_04890 [Gammaproteobacteria bacterium]